MNNISLENSSIHFSNYSPIFESWHYHFRYLISKNLAPVNVKQSKLLCLDPSNTSDAICCLLNSMTMWQYLPLVTVGYLVFGHLSCKTRPSRETLYLIRHRDRVVHSEHTLWADLFGCLRHSPCSFLHNSNFR